MFACACLGLALFAAGCSNTSPDTRATDESAVKDLDAQWSRSAASGDLDGTLSYYADDASLLPPGAAIASGKNAIRAVWSALLVPGNSVAWQANKVDVARSGDLAYTVGTYRATIRDAQGNPTADRGKYVEVWKKEAGAKWNVVADIFNSDLPPLPPPAPQQKASPRRGRHKHPARHGHVARRPQQ
jgi:uncharacterized protein (TIGR02246 family)